MEFFWGSDSVKTIYSIVATALYPETQVMYAAINTVNSGLLGPAQYVDNSADMGDGNSSVKWYTYFPGISAATPYGYMAVRHRDAGQTFPTRQNNPNQPLWSAALFAQYPVNS